MVFELRPGNDLTEEVRRLGCEQIGQALMHLSGIPGRQKSVHEARKCLKRTRSLLRIVRPALHRKVAARLDRHTAEIARVFSATRDSQAMVETLDELDAHFGPEWNPAVTSGLRAMFQGRMQRHAAAQGADRKTVRRLEKLRARIARLELVRGGGLGAGVEDTYARARGHFKQAYELGDGAAFHEWRKEAQRHWRQMQLLVAAWPEAMTVRIERARLLSQCLGEDHDIYVLLGHVRAAGPDLAPWSELERFYDGCIERQLAMRMAARNHGKLLFAERPQAFSRRLMRYWRAAGERYALGMAVTPVTTQTVVGFPAAAEPLAEPPAPVDTPGPAGSGPPVEPKNAAE